MNIIITVDGIEFIVKEIPAILHYAGNLCMETTLLQDMIEVFK